MNATFSSAGNSGVTNRRPSEPSARVAAPVRITGQVMAFMTLSGVNNCFLKGDIVRVRFGWQWLFDGFRVWFALRLWLYFRRLILWSTNANSTRNFASKGYSRVV